MKLTYCGFCHRDVPIIRGRIKPHRSTNKRNASFCISYYDNATARAVADLAEQLQDVDPKLAWDHLSELPTDELQRLTMLALAAIDVDQTVAQMFAQLGPVSA